ncbi:cyclin-dependent kinase 3-like [Aethina tumida]|uniref:cyclin-dependent kinase 3-like n=1 Tax=Aethina tumida TaxID=116153 RepID=UPI002147CD63|nr:cyclin-dependent kinase 3-like [Aethina tumida]
MESRKGKDKVTKTAPQENVKTEQPPPGTARKKRRYKRRRRVTVSYKKRRRNKNGQKRKQNRVSKKSHSRKPKKQNKIPLVTSSHVMVTRKATNLDNCPRNDNNRTRNKSHESDSKKNKTPVASTSRGIDKKQRAEDNPGNHPRNYNNIQQDSETSSEPAAEESSREAVYQPYIYTPLSDVLSEFAKQDKSTRKEGDLHNFHTGEDLEDYSLTEIGSGTFGTVFRASHNVTNETVALKRVNDNILRAGVPPETLSEIRLLRKLNGIGCENVVSLFGVAYRRRSGEIVEMYLVFEYCLYDLRKHMDVIRSPLSKIKIQSMFTDVIRGVAFMHSHGVMHRDLKPQNILICPRGILKIADFGLAEEYNCGKELSYNVVTLNYRAPEILLYQPYNFAVDMWSLGCILVEMHTFTVLFPGRTEQDQFSMILKNAERDEDGVLQVNLNVFDIQMSDDARNLAKKLLTFVGHFRITAEDTLKHPYIISKLV